MCDSLNSLQRSALIMKNHILHLSSSSSPYSSWQISFGGWNLVKKHLVSFCHKCSTALKSRLFAGHVTEVTHLSQNPSVRIFQTAIYQTYKPSVHQLFAVFFHTFSLICFTKPEPNVTSVWFITKNYFYPVIHSTSLNSLCLKIPIPMSNTSNNLRFLFICL